MRFPQAKVRLEDGSKILAFLDNNSEINMITSKFMENFQLAMRQRPKLELLLYTERSKSFLNLSKDVEIAISGLKTQHLIFMIEAGDHDLVLE